MNTTDYKTIKETLPSLIKGIDYDITILSNVSALLKEYMDKINWVGFYIYKDNVLKLGPFQGKPACMVIPLHKGVCGACASSKKTIVVPDVHEFPSHIACDDASRSEICIPVFKNNTFYGLLDIDSPVIGRFTGIDQENLENIVNILENELNNI